MMTLMTLVLKCEARVMTVPSLKAKAVTAEERSSVVERSVRLRVFTDTELDTTCRGAMLH